MSKNKLLLKVLSCLVVVLCSFSLFFTVIKFLSEKSIKAAAFENLNIEFRNGASDLQRVFFQIKHAMSELSVDLAASREFEDGTYINSNNIRADMRDVLVDRRQNEFSEFIESAFLVDASKAGYVYELTGTFSSDVFFEQYFSSDRYTADYWGSQTIYGDAFAIFAADSFCRGMGTARAEIELLPVSYKPQGGRYIMVILLDADAMVRKFGISGIYSKEGSLIYHINDETPLSKDVVLSGGDNEGKILRFIDEQNGNINIVKLATDAEIDGIKQTSGVMFENVLLAFFLILVFLSCFVAVRFYLCSSRLFVALGDNSIVKSKYKKVITTEKEAREAVKLITSQEMGALAESQSKESVLDSLFLQSKMRDIYVAIDDIENKIEAYSCFYMIYYRVNYIDKFEKYMNGDLAKATFFLKQLLEMYLQALGLKATTLQIEKNAIVSVFEANEKNADVKDVVDSVMLKLSNESEYAFFTIAVSSVCNGIENIKDVYDNLVELSKYGKPVAENEILYEGEVDKCRSRFYFSLEEMGKLSAVLQNGNEEEMVRKVDEILEYNIKKEINRFEVSLLCTEIINCGIKLVNRVLHTIPDNVDVTVAYKRIEGAYTINEYRKICVELLSGIMSSIKQNKREDDYIISYILDYVENHYAEDIYLNLFAEKLNLTGAYISSYFKEKMNVNLIDYVNNYRIKKSLKLSENPQNKNKDIAAMVGLPNINTFIRLFKKYTGYTPGEYRKKHFGE